MELAAAEVLRVLMRWMHIASMALLIGGAAFLRLIARPALNASPDRAEMIERFAAGFRPLVYAAAVGVIGSGLFNYMARGGRHTAFYHALFGIKMLLAAHVFASAFLMVRAGASDKVFFRRATGVFASGAAIILLSAYLRGIY
jgi:uncharacterized membrane protein